MATATRPKPKKRVTHEWTPEMERKLKNLVKSEETHTAAFTKFASEFEMSSGAVQQHWYSMKRRSLPAAKRMSDYSIEELIDMQSDITAELKGRFEKLHQLV